MRSGGAARRQQERGQREQEPPPDRAAVEADLRRVIAGSEAVQRRLGRHERAIASEVGRMVQLAAVCPDAERLAVAADKLAARFALVAVELISDAAHNAEAREALERYAAALEASAQTASFTEAMRRAAVDAATAPLLAEIAELRRAAAPRSRAAGAHRKRHLSVATSIGVTAAAAASLAGGTVIAAHDSASVHHWQAAPAAARLHQGPTDSAVLVPSSPARGYQPKHARPSADAASASPAPPSSPPVFTPAPQPPPPPSPAPSHVTFDGAINVQTDHLVVGPLQGAQLTFSAVGGPLSWTASAPDGLVLSVSSGILGDGQAMVIEVSVAVGTPAGSGVITITDGDGRPVSVPVTWAAVPAI